MSNDSDPYRGVFQQQPAPSTRPPRPRTNGAPDGVSRGPVQVEQWSAEAGAAPAAPRWGRPAMTQEIYVEDGYYDSEAPQALPASEAVAAGYTDGTAPGLPAGRAATAAHRRAAAAAATTAPVVYGRQVPAVREGSYVPAEVALDHLEGRRKSVPAKQGWRGMLHSLTRINIAPSKTRPYELSLQERVQRLVRTTFPMAVIGVKGGVGKTVVTEALGSTFSTIRGDRVIAVDLDPDAGNLISATAGRARPWPTSSPTAR